MNLPSESDLEFLRSIDTPTVCNLVEIVLPARRGHGYTVRHLHCPFPDLPPMVGFARTVTFKAKDAVPLGQAGYMQKRLDYLDYVAREPRPWCCAGAEEPGTGNRHRPCVVASSCRYVRVRREGSSLMSPQTSTNLSGSLPDFSNSCLQRLSRLRHPFLSHAGEVLAL
jgi:hypothetical protein